MKVLQSLLFSACLVAVPAAGSPAHPGAWLTSLDEALELAAETHRQILVDLWADWCTWCKRLEEDVFSTPEFQEYAQRFVLLRVDTEDGEEGTRLRERFQIDSLPTMLILTADQVKAGELQGYLKTEPFIQSLELERMMFHLLLKAYDEVDDSGDLETHKMMADDFHSRRDGARAASLYRRILEAGDADPDEVAWNRYLLADSMRLQGALQGARTAQQQARAAAQEIGDPSLVELADLLTYQIARDGLRCDDAESALVAFLVRHPDGQYRGQAEQALAAIRKDRPCA